jgi:hypothetical protein
MFPGKVRARKHDVGSVPGAIADYKPYPISTWNVEDVTIATII